MLPRMPEHQLRITDDHAAALDCLLLLADAGARWKEFEHALDLLDQAELAGGALSPEYELKRVSWELSADRALAR
jgi:hypothetical protein